MCSREQLVVDERQLDRVRDLLDLIIEATDVGVADVGHFLEHELLDLGTGQLLEQQARPRIHEDVIARPQLLADQHIRELAHTLLVGPTDHQCAMPVLEHVPDRDDLTGDLVAPGEHHVQRLVEHDLLPSLELVEVDLGAERDAHLAATR